jgi:hypothetical protein
MKVKPPPTLIAAATALLIFGGGSYLFGWSNLLTVRSIEITGAPNEQAKALITRSLDGALFRSAFMRVVLPA